MYDYAIIGGGPAGLTLAYVLGKTGKRCVLVEREETLGGCHRVTRVNGLFTEHSPRVYSDTFKNLQMLLTDMGSNFSDLFIPYKYSAKYSQMMPFFSKTDIISILGEFCKLIYNNDYGRDKSVEDMMNSHNLSESARNAIDNVCRMVDGVGPDKFTLYEFLQIINQQTLYSLYQPRMPNDLGLIKIWTDAIKKTGNVDILINTVVQLQLNTEQDTIN